MIYAAYTGVTTATRPVEGTGEYFWNFRLLNRVMEPLCDPDLYESPKDEPTPTGAAIVAAADLLRYVSPEDVQGVEIEPFFGELNLTWRYGGQKRVKVTFDANRAFSVYHERLDGGHVAEHHLEPHSTNQYLVDRLNWLHL